MRFPNGPGFGLFGGILMDVLAGLLVIIGFIVLVGLLVVLVRFLLVATKAAELYVAQHSPQQTATPAVPVTPVVAPAETKPTTTPTRARAPRTPPTT